MTETPWQLQIVKKSIKKREKLELLRKHLEVKAESKNLDLGCAQGILSFFLRQKGGLWVSVDEDFVNLETSRRLLEKNLVRIQPGPLPFKKGAFDQVVCLDYLEHLENDDLCLEEIRRVLKSGGRLLLVVPHTGNFFLLHKLRQALGLKLEFYGHKREGYSLKSLKAKLERAGFRVFRHETFSRFFSEFLELLLNLVYIKFLAPETMEKTRDGHIRPTTSAEFDSRKKTFRIYSLVHPLIRTLSRLDILLFFQKGYSLAVWAEKESGPAESCDIMT